MNILAPVNTYDSAVALITAGAKEIYLAGDDQLFKTFSFTGRGKVSPNGIVASSFPEVRQIVDYAHANGAKVNFLGNFPLFKNGLYKGKELEKYFLEYIERGIETGVDALVIGDLGLLKLIQKMKYPVEIHASVFMRTINEDQLKFLKQFGVNRTVLSYHVTMEEIEALAANNTMDLEVIGYLGCSFYNGSCGFMHDLGEGVKDDFDPGVSCRGHYKVSDGERTGISKVFDAEAGCSICSLGRLDVLGVETLKIVGRARDFKQTARVISLYAQSLEKFRQGATVEEVKKDVPRWWSKLWCSKQRCKYKTNNANYSYIIGG